MYIYSSVLYIHDQIHLLKCIYIYMSKCISISNISIIYYYKECSQGYDINMVFSTNIAFIQVYIHEYT